MFGKKSHAIEVINYEGPQDVFVWKHSAEDFNTKSQLIVHESQEAIFFRNGQALDAFPAGRYTLETQNLPLIRKVVGLATGGVSPFHCEVYYINKAVSMGMPWGTNSPIEMVDPEYGLPIQLTSYGDFSLRVQEGRKLLVKLVGTVRQYTQEEISRYFTEIMAAHIRDAIANTMEQNQIGAMHINTQLLNLSRKIQEQLAPVFGEYGLLLNHFAVSSVKVRGLEEMGQVIKKVKIETIAESGKANIERMKIGVDAERIQATGAAENAVKLGLGLTEAQINQAKGITEAQLRAFDVAEKLAQNTGPSVVLPKAGPDAAGFAAAAIPVVSSPAGASSDIVKAALGQAAAPASDPKAVRKARLQELKEWYEDELITEEEYQQKRAEILNSL